MTGQPRSDHFGHSANEANHKHRVQFLIGGDESALPELEAVLSTLPLCATGRVFVEVESEDQIGTLDVPPRMTVTWLPRSRRSGAPGSGSRCVQGEAFSRAVRAWAGEMLCDDPEEAHVWLGGHYRGVAEAHEYLTTSLGVSADVVQTPPAYRLGVKR
ncbi:NADPH-dependent ferric siderophore reductase [Okibacterium sp. HSC-33S16]|uniref:SIP domain-containing protein n=1 Tax=Okibacterium sp. HSC-33S16 TaxID=2910965 RepID=UPI0020A01A95|nr:SIP domain-containing protein [Okibacterium sp. HSC-33S16]MCP2031770.1 NADPH-dependent ferric siderophore reductase [Okibacterium sp. HSC-33S16]